MVRKLGMKINFDEARVLVASGDNNGSNDLTLDEFMDMIYHDNDAMNVDIAKLSKLNSQN